jgi:hypothetical protein
MYIRYYTSSLIFFAYWDRRRLPAGRQERPKRPNINLLPIIFLSFLPTGKVADYQNMFSSQSLLLNMPLLISKNRNLSFFIQPNFRSKIVD